MVEFNQRRFVALAVFGLVGWGCGSGGTKAVGINAFAVSAACVSSGATVSLTWDVDGHRSCEIDPDGEALHRNKGSLDVEVSETTEFVLRCKTPAGTQTRRESVFVPEDDRERSLDIAASYERIPATPEGLDYEEAEFLPVRYADVQLLDGCDGTVLESDFLDDEGRVSLVYDGSNVVKVRLFSEVADPPIQVVDNTNDGAIYVLESRTHDQSESASITLRAESGWGSSEYGSVRASGPFAILDTMLTAKEAFLAVTDVDYPQLTVNWSVNNRPETARGEDAIADGAIGTSYWDPRAGALFILGQQDVDTDEFDAHVLVHEWGHYFESALGRSDSIGGPHGFDDVLDPRVAFSEGWGNALSAMILNPQTIYIDTFQENQELASGFRLDDNSADIDPNPGWFSESSVQAILFDLFDASGDDQETWDDISLGLLPIYRVLTGPMRETTAFTSIFPFIDHLSALQPADAGAIDALLAKHEIDPIVGPWGENQTNPGPNDPEVGGISENLPVYNELSGPGDSVTLTLAGGPFAADQNKLGQNRFIRFQGTGGTVAVASTSDRDIDLYAYEKGERLAAAFGVSGNENIEFATKSDLEYVVHVQGFETEIGTYSTTIELTTP